MPMPDKGIIDEVNSPEDIRYLDHDQLSLLAKEIRSLIIKTVSRNGGHLASNLGAVELTLALHRVFDFSVDRLYFDVGHQCYTHKIITGRRDQFHSLRQKSGISGFPNPRESDFDPLLVGHASTSISSAVGFAEAVRGIAPRRQAVAVIGDGAIGGGMAFEALNHAGQSRSDVLIVLNDNNMAIAATTGALSRYLTDLRTRPETRNLRQSLSSLLTSIPVAGKPLKNLQEHVLSGLKGLIEATHIFSALGFKYFGPLDGHDLGLLETELARIKEMRGPRILHVATEKGRGFAAAAADPERYHSAAPFSMESRREHALSVRKVAYTDVFADSLALAAEDDSGIVAITAAMPSGTGIRKFGKKFPSRFYDVGICEAHAVTFAASLAKSGKKAVLAIYSTFLQRGYDQLIHDVAVQGKMDLVLAIDRAGLVGSDGPTHHGVFDISFLRHIPGLVLMAPRDGAELSEMLTFALASGGVIAIRYPRGATPETDALARKTAWPTVQNRLDIGKAEILRQGDDGAVIAYGRMVFTAWLAADILAKQGKNVTVVNARFAKPLDTDLFANLARSQPWLMTVEDHALQGGFGSGLLEALADAGIAAKIRRLGIPDCFIEHAEQDQLDAMLGLDAASVAKAALELYA